MEEADWPKNRQVGGSIECYALSEINLLESEWKVVLTRIIKFRYFGGGRFRSVVPNLGCLSPVGVQRIISWE